MKNLPVFNSNLLIFNLQLSKKYDEKLIRVIKNKLCTGKRADGIEIIICLVETTFFSSMFVIFHHSFSYFFDSFFTTVCLLAID